MNIEEKQILHGLYFVRRMVGEFIPISSGEIMWLTKAALPSGRTWKNKDGSLKTSEEAGEDYLARIGATSAAAERPLVYLHQMGYIEYEKQHGLFRIAVTARGADLARELDTHLGRLNVFYREHKDGVLWLVVTVLVSFATSLVTSLLSGK